MNFVITRLTPDSTGVFCYHSSQHTKENPHKQTPKADNEEGDQALHNLQQSDIQGINGDYSRMEQVTEC